MITRQSVENKLHEYLNGEIQLAELVDWAESAMYDADFELKDVKVLREVVSQIGLADVAEFGMTWEDTTKMLKDLGYVAEVGMVAA